MQKGQLKAIRQEATSTTAKEVSASNPYWKARLFINEDAAISIFLGQEGVSGATNGIELKAGEPFTDTLTTSKWFARAASGTPNLKVVEVE